MAEQFVKSEQINSYMQMVWDYDQKFTKKSEFLNALRKALGETVCMACFKLGHCVIKDDAVEIAAKMHDADALVFASPVYYYSVSGQLKTMFDRSNPLYDSDYAFKEIYFLSTAAEDEDYTNEGSVKAVQGWIDCFDRATLAGVVFAGGVNDIGDIKDHLALQKAYEMGKSV